MKTNCPPLRLLAVLALSLALTGDALALSVADLAGSWRLVSYSTPSQLSLQKNGNNQVIGIPERQHFDYGSGQVTFDSAGNMNGTFSEGGDTPSNVSGTAAITGQGQITITIPGDEEGPTVAHINASMDFMISVKSNNEGFNDFLFLLKEPASVTGADLQGNWGGFGFETPNEIGLIGSPATSITGANKLNSYPGSLTVSGAGTFSGSLDGTFTGSFSSYADGDLSLNIIPSEDDPFAQVFFINAGKNIMMQVLTDGGSSSRELVVFVKKPTTAVTSDRVGHWRIGFMGIPNSLTPVFDGNSFITELNNRNHFETAAEHLTVGTDGFLTGAFGDGSTIGNADSVSASGLVEFTIDNEEEESFSLQLNAARDVLFALNTDSFNQEFLFLVKTPPPSGNLEQMGLITLKNASVLDFFWAAHPGRVLQESTDLIDWATIPSTQGNHQYTPSLSGNKYYRVVVEEVP